MGVARRGRGFGRASYAVGTTAATHPIQHEPSFGGHHVTTLTLTVNPRKPDVASLSQTFKTEAEGNAFVAGRFKSPVGGEIRSQVRLATNGKAWVATVWARRPGTKSHAVAFFESLAEAKAQTPPPPPTPANTRRNGPVRTSYACVRCGVAKLPKPGACAPCVEAAYGKAAPRKAGKVEVLVF